MNSKERQLLTILHNPTDRISVDAICVENQAEIAKYLNINPADVLDRLGIDGRIISANYVGKVKDSENGIYYTEWGTPITGDYSTYRFNPLENAENVSEVEKYPYPNPDQYDFESAGNLAKALSDKYAVRGPYWQPLFCRACDLFGLEKALVNMLVQPSVFEAVIDNIFNYLVKFCENLLSACEDSMPIFCLGDDFATQRGLMMSPELWRKFLKPRYAKLFEIGKNKGKFVWFHSCGDITAVLPDLIDIGMDVWETVQLHTLPMSPEKLKREYGKYITFFGGINTQRLPFISPEEVKTEVLNCIKILGKDGGYICGPDHHIKPDVSVENTLALFDTATSWSERI